MKSISFSIWLKGKISAIHLEQYQILVEACNCNSSLYSCDKVKHFIWYIFWQMLHWICLAWINMFLQHMSHLSMTIYVENYHTQFHNGFNELNNPVRRQAIISTDAELLLIGSVGTNFSDFFFEIQLFSWKKIRLKMSSAKWQPFCLGLNVLKWSCTEE